jgi:hypothetical protein
MNDEARRFWSKVEKSPTCWLWTAGRFRDGAGAFGVGGRAVHAHYWAYEHRVGPIPAGLELGHVCRVQLCVRPAHLKPVTHRVNASRAVVARRRAAHEREADTAAHCLARLPDAGTPLGSAVESDDGARVVTPLALLVPPLPRDRFSRPHSDSAGDCPLGRKPLKRK